LRRREITEKGKRTTRREHKVQRAGDTTLTPPVEVPLSEGNHSGRGREDHSCLARRSLILRLTRRRKKSLVFIKFHGGNRGSERLYVEKPSKGKKDEQTWRGGKGKALQLRQRNLSRRKSLVWPEPRQGGGKDYGGDRHQGGTPLKKKSSVERGTNASGRTGEVRGRGGKKNRVKVQGGQFWGERCLNSTLSATGRRPKKRPDEKETRGKATGKTIRVTLSRS